MTEKKEPKPAAWWRKAKTLSALIRAKIDSTRQDLAAKKKGLDDLKSQGLIGEDDHNRQLRRFKLIEGHNTWLEILKALKLTDQGVEDVESGKKRLTKEDADSMANLLGCPPNAVYAATGLGSADDKEPDDEPEEAGPSAKKNQDPPAPAKKALKAGPRKRARGKGHGKAGRPKGTGKRQQEAKLLDEAASRERPPPSQLLVGLTRKKAFERLASLAQIQARIYAWLAKDEDD